MNKKVTVIGGGSWGTALAITLSGKGHQVNIWDISAEHTENMQKDRENKKYLPGAKFPDTLAGVVDLEKALDGADFALFAAPAQRFRDALSNALPFISKDVIVINVAKGIEQHSLKRMSEVAKELAPDLKYVVLSGPSHAEEVGKSEPKTLVVAAEDISLADEVQDLFMTDRFRVYTGTDVVGVELGGALKNIIALGAGISDGMNYGDNAKAAMMTRGISEISRLGAALGADEHTFSGLSGIGDLIVTCTSVHSRNRQCGIMIGEGMSPEEAVKKVGMVVEGMYTTEAAYELAQKVGVEMPITEGIYAVIKGEVNAGEAVDRLMNREKKMEKCHI